MIWMSATQAVMDALALALGFQLANWSWAWFRGAEALPMSLWQTPLFILIVVSIIVFRQLGLYRREKSILNIEETEGLLKGMAGTALILLSVLFFLQEVRNPGELLHMPWLTKAHRLLVVPQIESFPRLLVALTFIYGFMFCALERYLLFKWYQDLHLKGLGHINVVILGYSDIAIKLFNKINQSPKLGYQIRGFVCAEAKEDLPSVWLGPPEDLEQLFQKNVCQKLIVAHPDLPTDDMIQIANLADQYGVSLEFVPRLYALYFHRTRVTSLDGLPLVSLQSTRISPFTTFVKRLFDLIVGCLLLVLFLPLMGLIAAWIKGDSKGPVFFRQKRVGLNGKAFTIYKFRTMDQDADKYAVTPQASDDPRITKSGAFLRRTSLDELPQLFNVLRGQMSLVGPRPEMPFIVETYSSLARERLKVKPGITGLWQISADRAIQIHENLDYDMYYIEHMSLLLDITILLRTAMSVVLGKGAW